MDWDSENYEPPVIGAPASVNKWDGEDEEDNVKDSWEDAEEDEKRKLEQQNKKSVQTKKSKSKLEEKIEERERKENERQNSRLKEIQNELAFEPDTSDMTPEEKKAEKLRRQKLQDELELEMAKEMLGVQDDNVTIDNIRPRTKEDYTTLCEAIYNKISIYKESEHFPQFSDDLILKICVLLNSSDLKKLKISIDNIFAEKLKLEKAEKTTKKVKGKGKARLRVEGDNKYDEFSAYTVDDYDDFM